MTRITLRQLLDHAALEGYGVHAFNISSIEQLIAISAGRSVRGSTCNSASYKRSL